MNKLTKVFSIVLVFLLTVGVSSFAINGGLSLGDDIFVRLDNPSLYIATDMRQLSNDHLNLLGGVKPGYHGETWDIYGLIQAGMIQSRSNRFTPNKVGVGAGVSYTNRQYIIPFKLGLEGKIFNPDWMTYDNKQAAIELVVQVPFGSDPGGE